MSHSKSHPQFLNWWLKQKIDSDRGFTLTEALVAIIILTIAFIINLQFLVSVQIKNLKQEIEAAAITVSKEIMDDVRFQLQSELDSTIYPTGPTPTQIAKSAAGYDFYVDVYVCTGEPTVASDQSVTCPSGNNPDIRYIVVQVIDGGRLNEKLYTVESVFTKLR